MKKQSALVIKNIEPKSSELNSLFECYQNKQYEDAEKLALILTNKYQTHPFGWKILGAIFSQTGRSSEGLIACIKSVELSPENAEAHYNLGVIFKELGRLKEAEESYRKATVLKPNYALAQFNLGNILKQLDRLEEAEESYSKGIILKPGFSEALLNRGQLLFDKGEFEVALRDFDLCNTKSSRARSLSCLYALGRIEDIYKRIELQDKVDGENLRVAAIASFITEREQKDTANNFCKNPLEFIHFSNISTHLENSNLFIEELIEELHNVKTTWEPFNKTTHKGFQSKINLFENPLEKMSYLKSIIIDELDLYYLRFKNESCSYIQKWPSKKNLYGWHVILKQQGNQKVHIHPSGWLSGVIYLKVVPTLGKDEGSIEFGLSGKRYSHLDSPKLIHQPNLGDIVFFPSSLHHRTIPFSTDTDRIIVSFDLMPKGNQKQGYESN